MGFVVVLDCFSASWLCEIKIVEVGFVIEELHPSFFALCHRKIGHRTSSSSAIFQLIRPITYLYHLSRLLFVYRPWLGVHLYSVFFIPQEKWRLKLEQKP